MFLAVARHQQADQLRFFRFYIVVIHFNFPTRRVRMFFKKYFIPIFPFFNLF